MGINITKLNNLWGNQEHEWLVGNAGDFGAIQFDIECLTNFDSNINGSVTIISSSPLQFKLDTGNWQDFGFVNEYSGTTLINYVELSFYKITDGVEGGAGNNGATFSISGSVLTFNDGALSPPSSSFPSSSVVNTVVTDDTTSVVSTYHVRLHQYKSLTELADQKPIDQLEINLSLIPNNALESNSVSSIIDGTKTAFRFDNLIALLPADGAVDMISTGFQSGMAVRNATLEKIDHDAQTYQLTIYYMIHGFYDAYNDFLNNIFPDYLKDQESLTPNFDIRAWPVMNNPNNSMRIINKELQLGNVGWIDETFNGRENNFVISDFLIKDQFNNYYTTIPYNVATTVTFSVTNENVSVWNGSVFSAGILHAQKDADNYKSNNNSFLDNFHVNCLGNENEGYVFLSGGSSVEDSGFGVNGETITLKIKPTQTTPGILDVQIEVIPSAAFSAYMDAQPEDDRLCYFWFSAGDIADIAKSEKATLTLIKDDFEKALPIRGEYDNLTARFVTHQYTPTEDGVKTVHSLPNDDLTGKVQVWLPNADEFKLTGVTYAIEAIKNGTIHFTLDSVFLDTSLAVILEDGTQQINKTVTRGYKLYETNEKNTVSFVRDPSIDAGSLNGYYGLFGWKNRWEYWIALDDVNSEFFDSSEPNTGYNHDWSRYGNDPDNPDWDLYFVVYLHGQEADGNEIIYRNTHKYFIGDYSDNPLITSQFYFRDAEGALLVGGDDGTGKNLGIILSDVKTRFEIHYTHVNDWTQEIMDSIYATATIEVDEGIGMLSMRQISSDIYSEPSNPLTPITGNYIKMEIDTDPKVLIVSFDVDPAKIDIGAKYRFTGRLGCGTLRSTITNPDPDLGQYNSQYNDQYD